jgi:hypothetical protein
MHVPFKIHYRNNLIDKKDSYLIPRPASWDDRNYSYGHQLTPVVNGCSWWGSGPEAYAFKLIEMMA